MPCQRRSHAGARNSFDFSKKRAPGRRCNGADSKPLAILGQDGGFQPPGRGFGSAGIRSANSGQALPAAGRLDEVPPSGNLKRLCGRPAVPRPPRLRSVPNGGDRNPFAPHPVENQIRSASNHQFTNSRLTSSTAQVRMVFQSFDQGDDPRRQRLSRISLVPGHVGSYLPQPRTRQRRPDDLYRHSASSLCGLPQTHFGGGSSRSVPHERSQAFMSSCVT